MVFRSGSTPWFTAKKLLVYIIAFYYLTSVWSNRKRVCHVVGRPSLDSLVGSDRNT